MLRPYPTELPAEAWSILANAFRGVVPDKATAIHVAYEALGYGLNAGVPDGSGPPVKLSVAPLAAEDAAKLCDGQAAGSLQGLFPWSKLIPLIIDLIGKLIV